MTGERAHIWEWCVRIVLIGIWVGGYYLGQEVMDWSSAASLVLGFFLALWCWLTRVAYVPALLLYRICRVLGR
ncbi:MAG: hypothetical protein QW838_05895 [Candidatus Nitrosotenuis sp.]